MLDSIVGIVGVVIAVAQLYLQLSDRPHPPLHGPGDRVSAGDDWVAPEVAVPETRGDERSRTESPRDWVERQQEQARRENEDWIERQQERARREHEAFHARFEADWARSLAGSGRSLALLAAVCLAIGSVAYILAARGDARTAPPQALT